MAKDCVISRGPRKGKLKKGYRFKNGRCVKKKRKKACKRVHRKVEGVTVALPCRARSLSPAMSNRLDDEFTQAEWNKCAKKDGCRVIFFTAGNPVMRMPGRKLVHHGPMPCVTKNGRFTKCRGGAKRLRAGRRR